MNLLLGFILLVTFASSTKLLVKQDTRLVSPDDINNLPIFRGGIIRLIPICCPNIVIPLRNINISIRIQENIARVEIEQEYENNTPRNLETEYYFPISEAAVFDSFQARIGDRTIKGRIKEKKVAREEFETAVRAGSTAAITEITRTKDIMKVKIGNFLPGQKITLKYSYIELLDVTQNKFWRLIVFSTLTPLYSPRNFTSPPIFTVRPNPVTYKWTITTEIRTTYPIQELKVPSHQNEVLVSYYNKRTHVMINFDPSKEYNPNKNYEVYYNTLNDHVPKLVLENFYNYTNPTDDTFNNNNNLLGYISFFPEFNNSTPLSNAFNIGRLENPVENESSPQEFIFVSDRSGSMSGDRVRKLKKALTSILRILPSNSYFNIISFGSTYEPMFPISQKVEDYRTRAINRVSLFEANFGGTEMLQPLNYAFNLPYINSYPRIIFLLTDGDISNPDQLIDTTRKHKIRARVNTVGIGSGASNYLIRGVANAGDGKYEFISDDQDLAEKVVLLATSSISYYLTNFRVEFSDDKFIKYTYPKINELQFILKNDKFDLFFFLNELFDLENDSLNITISYYDSLNNQNQSHVLTIEPNKNDIINGTILHKFAVKKRIDDLSQEIKANPDESDAIKGEIVTNSINYQVLSELTAFVMVIQDNEGREIQPLTDVLIPNIASIDYRPGGISAFPRAMPFFNGGGHHAHGVSAFRPNGAGDRFPMTASVAPVAPVAPVIDTTTPLVINVATPTRPQPLTNVTFNTSDPYSLHEVLLKMIPQSYWVDKDNISLQTYNSTLLACDSKMKIANRNIPSNETLWTPLILTNNLIVLRSFWSTYLSFNNTHISCDSTQIEPMNMINISQMGLNDFILIKNSLGEDLTTNTNNIIESRVFYPPNRNVTITTTSSNTTFNIRGLET